MHLLDTHKTKVSDIIASITVNKQCIYITSTFTYSYYRELQFNKKKVCMCECVGGDGTLICS